MRDDKKRADIYMKARAKHLKKVAKIEAELEESQIIHMLRQTILSMPPDALKMARETNPDEFDYMIEQLTGGE